MKNDYKSSVANVVMLILGIVILAFAIMYKNDASSMLVGLGSALSFSALVAIVKNLYWRSPSKKNEYAKLIKNENISLKDERKIMLRDKSGRISYIIGLVVLGVSIWIFMILKAFNIFDAGRMFFIFAGGFVLFEFFLGLLVFRYLEKKM